jgi:hypothetical protein
MRSKWRKHWLYWLISSAILLAALALFSDADANLCKSPDYTLPAIICCTILAVFYYFQWRRSFAFLSLLALAASIFWLGSWGFSPLRYAALTNHTSLAHLFLALGADPEVTHSELIGKASLETPAAAWAATCGNTEAMQVLLTPLEKAENVALTLLHAFHHHTTAKQQAIALEYARSLPQQKRTAVCIATQHILSGTNGYIYAELPQADKSSILDAACETQMSQKRQTL